MKLLYALLTCAGMACYCNVSKAQTQEASLIPSVSPLYLQKLIDTAKANYPRMKFHQGRLSIAKTSLAIQKLSWFDALTFSYIYQPNNTLSVVSPSFFNGGQVSVFLNIATLLQKPLTIKQKKQEVDVSTSELGEYALNLELAVKTRYYLYLQQIETLKLRRRAAVDAEAIVKQMRIQFEKSERTLQDYSGALLLLTEQQQFIIEAEGSLLTAKAQIEELIGMKLEDIK